MAHETNQNIPMTAAGCRQQPAPDETGAFPTWDAESTGNERWIYGDPQLHYGGQPASSGVPGYTVAGTNMPGTMLPGGVDNEPMPIPGMNGAAMPIPGMNGAAMPIPGMNGAAMPGGISSSAAQGERMRNPVSMADTHSPANAQQAYQASLRSLLDRNVGYFVVATFLIGTGQSVTWQGILHTVGSDYLVLYQPDYGRYISGDLYSLKFVQFHNVKGIPYCAASQSWQGQSQY